MTLARGRIAPKRDLVGIRPITREDLPRLVQQPRDKTGTQPQRLRDSHHQVARLLSTGIELNQVAALTGYSINRVHQLAHSPAMLELVAHYRAQVDGSFVASVDAYYDLATQNMLSAERHLADRIAELDAESELLSVREALAISRDAADRFGYGKKQTNVNVNVDYAAALERAIARSGKQIEGTTTPPPGGNPRVGAPSTQPHPAEPRPQLRRLGNAA